jgi:hypothetical protein
MLHIIFLSLSLAVIFLIFNGKCRYGNDVLIYVWELVDLCNSCMFQSAESRDKDVFEKFRRELFASLSGRVKWNDRDCRERDRNRKPTLDEKSVAESIVTFVDVHF